MKLAKRPGLSSSRRTKLEISGRHVSSFCYSDHVKKQIGETKQMQMTERFEGQIVGYMFNQAKMPFFVVGAYKHYKIENGRMVTDNGAESQALRAETNALYELISQVSSRVKRGMRVPSTWLAKLETAETLVLAMRECRVITQEWADEFARMVRFTKQYQA